MTLAMGIVSSILYYLKGKQRENKMERILLSGMSILALSITVGIFFSLLADFQVEGFFIGTTFYGDYTVHGPLFKVFFMLFLVVSASGVVLFLFIIEFYVKRTKYIITTGGVSFLVISLLFPFEQAEDLIMYVFAPAFFAIVFIIFLMFLRYSPREFKLILLLILISFASGIITILSRAPDFKSLSLMPIITYPLIYLLINIIFLFLASFSLKSSSRLLLYSVIGFIFSIGVVLDIFCYFISPILMVVGLFLFVIAGYMVLKALKMTKSGSTPNGATQFQSFSTIFTRPEKLTDEEVSVSKEKKICLVCKGEISRLNYLCPGCYSFYCVRCKEALSNLENTCWACFTPIDPAKPMKIEQLKDGKVEIANGITKDHTKKDNNFTKK
ncbi:MAG: hypothetical protein ACFFCS_26275 [Candidatus Hodarchaeota archaeon]